MINLAYEKVEPALRQFVEGFFYLYAVNFNRHMQTIFDVKDPFVDSYKACLDYMFDDFQVNDTDGAIQEKLINFFVVMVDEEQANLALNAAEL